MNSAKIKRCSVLLQVVLSAFITFFLFELVGLYTFYKQYHSIFYFRSTPSHIDTEEESHTKDIVSQLKGKLVLDPYLGFIHTPLLPLSRVAGPDRLKRLLSGSKTSPSWPTLKTNNYGFFAPIDYPYIKGRKEEFIIGIFGGSVAQWFALQGADRLKNELVKQNLLKDYDLKVLNFSQGGFKQPQQLQTLSFFLAAGQEFDAIVNIDGFNEIALAFINSQSNIDPLMPSFQHTFPLLKLLGSADNNIAVVEELYLLRESENKLRFIKKKKQESNLACLYLVYSFWESKAQKEYATLSQTFGQKNRSEVKRTNIVHVMKADNVSKLASVENALSVWFRSSVTMQKLCDSENILYLEVVQPNQYYSEKKFSSEEQAIALNEKSPYREAVELGYPLLYSHVHNMKRQGVNVVSAVDIFDEVDTLIYSDSCCHYNQIGNEILARYVANAMSLMVEN